MAPRKGGQFGNVRYSTAQDLRYALGGEFVSGGSILVRTGTLFSLAPTSGAVTTYLLRITGVVSSRIAADAGRLLLFTLGVGVVVGSLSVVSGRWSVVVQQPKRKRGMVPSLTSLCHNQPPTTATDPDSTHRPPNMSSTAQESTFEVGRGNGVTPFAVKSSSRRRTFGMVGGRGGSVYLERRGPEYTAPFSATTPRPVRRGRHGEGSKAARADGENLFSSPLGNRRDGRGYFRVPARFHQSRRLFLVAPGAAAAVERTVCIAHNRARAAPRDGRLGRRTKGSLNSN